MTTIPRHPDDHDTVLPEPLASGLHGLRTDIPPAGDLWPAIAARLEPRARPAAPRHGWRRHLRRRNAGYASAAAVMLAVAIGWQFLPMPTAIPPAPPVPGDIVATGAAADADSPLLQAADALAREYQGALREVEAASGAAAAGNGLGAELERSAVEVRAALASDPDALYLFHRLQRIYAHRLALSLRQA